MADRLNTITINFLGTGSNGGIPQIDCRCRNCSKQNVGIHRLRSSILLKSGKTILIVDCGPDFREQLLKENLRLNQISAIIISHLHPDHSIGLLELGNGKPLSVPISAHPLVCESLIKNEPFQFLFINNFAKISPAIHSPFEVNFIKIPHGNCDLAFAIKILHKKKSILIATDISKITEDFIEAARKVDLIIFDGTFLKNDSHGHMCIEKSSEILKRLKTKIIFTHVNHSENLTEMENFLKGFGFSVAKDGQSITL